MHTVFSERFFFLLILFFISLIYDLMCNSFHTACENSSFCSFIAGYFLIISEMLIINAMEKNVLGIKVLVDDC
jgi:hypothetical protein